MSFFHDIRNAVERAAEDGGRLAAEAVLQEAQRNVPVGDPRVDPDPSVSLKDSGHIMPLPEGGYRVEFDTPYAAWIHENLHAEHPRGGEAKYLERALTTLAPQLSQIMATAVRAQIDRRTGRRGNRPA